MKKSCTLGLLLCALPAFAQITVTNATFPFVGDTLHFKSDANPLLTNNFF